MVTRQRITKRGARSVSRTVSDGVTEELDMIE